MAAAMWGMQKEGKLDPLLMGSHHHMHIASTHRLPPVHTMRHQFLPGHHPHLLNGRAATPTTSLWNNADSTRRKRFEPFCSPLVPHVPIRERLARRGTSVDVSDEALPGSSYCAAFYGQPRRRRMSLLQTLRQQNRQLTDSGFELHRPRTESDSTNRDSSPPPSKTSPPPSPSRKALASLKAKIFGKKDKRLDSRQSSNTIAADLAQDGNGRSRKSPSTTNDSGRGSQGHLEDRLPEANCEPQAVRRISADRRRLRYRTNSCPSLPGLCNLRHPTRSFDNDDDEEDREEELIVERMMRNSSPLSAADSLLERRLLRRALEIERRRLHETSLRQPRATIAIPESCSESATSSQLGLASPADSALNSDTTENKACPQFDAIVDVHQIPHIEDEISVASISATEDLCDYDDSSTLLLDHYLPLSRSALDNIGALSASLSALSATADYQDEIRPSISGTAISCQTDLSLVRIPATVGAYLSRLSSDEPPSPEGMNFIAKHFFEYQSFVNLPHKAVQLHKPQASQAGVDPAAAWAPKNMNKAGKNQPAPAARAGRTHRDPRPNGTKHGRAARHEHREWGDRHGELKEEKIAPHKDAWTKFLANEDPTSRTVFECDFEDTVLQVEEESLPDRVARTTADQDDLDFQMAYNADKPPAHSGLELLIILTYAPLVQFVTVTVKKAKCLPYNSSPFCRIMLFDGRRLVEQKQTTVDPSVGVTSSVDSAKPSSSSVCSSLSSNCGDAAFSESFLFHVPPAKLDKAHIVIEVFDNSPSGAVSVGHCVIGRLGNTSGQAHWLQMVRKNTLPVCMWHRMHE